MSDGVRDGYRMSALGDVLRLVLRDPGVVVSLEGDVLRIEGAITLTPYYEKIVADEVRARDG